MFSEIAGAQALLRKHGVYKPVKLYDRRGELYAAAAGGYVRVYANGSTSLDRLNIVELHIDGPLSVDKMGRLRCDTEGFQLECGARERLLGGRP